MFYLDPNFNFHWLESAPSGNVHLIEKYLTKFNEVQKSDRFTKEQKAAAIASLLKSIAKLARVDYDLLLADIDGVLNAIATVNFTSDPTHTECAGEEIDQTNTNEETVSLENYHYQLITTLVNTELAVDLESALKIADNTPFKRIKGYIAARIKFLNQDKIKEEKKAKETKELEQFIDKQIADGTFYNDLLDPSKAGKVPIDLAMLK